MARPFDLDGVEAFVSASVGVAFLSGPEDSADTLLRDADVAMYRAKSASGNRYEIFDNAMRAWATERFEMEAALRHAIERHELDVEYQPQVRAGTAELVGFEALARWTRPTGIVTPDVFIPLAEETGLVAGIDALGARAGLCTGGRVERGGGPSSRHPRCGSASTSPAGS